MLPRTTLLRLATATATLTLSGGAYAIAHDTTAAAGVHRTTLHLTADAHGKLRFNTGHLAARAGTVTIVLRNPKSSGMPHSVGISGHGVQKVSKVVPAGGSATATAKLKHGRYSYFCTVPGHAAGGMKGTLTVR